MGVLGSAAGVEQFPDSCFLKAGGMDQAAFRSFYQKTAPALRATSRARAARMSKPVPRPGSANTYGSDSAGLRSIRRRVRRSAAAWFVLDWLSSKGSVFAGALRSIVETAAGSGRNPDLLLLVSIGIVLVRVRAFSALRVVLGRFGFVKLP
jgi:hypothetical protein